MVDVKDISTLLAPYFILSVVQGELSEEEATYMKRIPYSNVVGSLIYAMIPSKPDIAYRVSSVSTLAYC